MNPIKAGQVVSFTFRGEKMQGTVIRIRISERRGRARQVALAVTGDAGALDREVVEIAGTRKGKPCVYTVELGSVSAVVDDKGRDGAMQATQVKSHIKATRRQHAYEQIQLGRERLQHTYKTPVYPGDKIEVKFSDIGWTEVVFDGFVQDSGNCRFIHRGKSKTISPKFIRAVGSTLN